MRISFEMELWRRVEKKGGFRFQTLLILTRSFFFQIVDHTHHKPHHKYSTTPQMDHSSFKYSTKSQIISCLLFFSLQSAMQKIHSTIYSSQIALLLSAHPPCALFLFILKYSLSDKNNLQLLSALHFLLKFLCLTQGCFTPLLWYCTATAIAILCYLLHVLFPPFFESLLRAAKF